MKLDRRHVRILAGLSGSTIAVYLWHCVCASSRGISREARRDIARHLDMHEASVTKAERRLEAEGLIEVRRPSGATYGRSGIAVVELVERCS